MKDIAQLPYLIKLMDDSSPRVREKIADELRDLGPQVEVELRLQNIALSPDQRVLLDDILKPDADALLRRDWLSWLEQRDEYDRLEAALGLLAQWQAEDDDMPHLPDILDALAGEFSESELANGPVELSRWLFSSEGKNLRGAPAESMYNPRYSNLVDVVESGRGIPISLSCLFMLVGRRVGLQISGCNFPGHFLVRSVAEDMWGSPQELIFDPYDGGRVLTESEVMALHKAAPLAMSEPSSAIITIARVLRNLVVAYEQVGSLDKARFMLDLLGELESVVEGS